MSYTRATSASPSVHGRAISRSVSKTGISGVIGMLWAIDQNGRVDGEREGFARLSRCHHRLITPSGSTVAASRLVRTYRLGIASRYPPVWGVVHIHVGGLTFV